jgi:hypothetical protein
MILPLLRHLTLIAPLACGTMAVASQDSPPLESRRETVQYVQIKPSAKGWTRRIPAVPESFHCLELDNKIVIASASDAFAIAAGSGRLLWRSSLGSQEFKWTLTRKLVADSSSVLVYMRTSKGGKLMAFDATSGARLWERQIGIVPENESIQIQENIAWVLESRSKVVAIDLRNGNLLGAWTNDIEPVGQRLIDPKSWLRLGPIVFRGTKRVSLAMAGRSDPVRLWPWQGGLLAFYYVQSNWDVNHSGQIGVSLLDVPRPEAGSAAIKDRWNGRFLGHHLGGVEVNPQSMAV